MADPRRDYPPIAACIAAIGLALVPLRATSDPPTPQTLPASQTTPALPASPTLPAEATVEEVVVSTPEPRYVAPTTRDRIGRIWAPVLINGKGPFRLVLDTGASHSAITQRVADEVGLPISTKAARLRGVTGSAVVSTVKADSLEFG